MIPATENNPQFPWLTGNTGVTGGGVLPPGVVPAGGPPSSTSTSSSSSGSHTLGGPNPGYQPPTSTSVGPKDCPPGVPPQVCAMMSIGGGFEKDLQAKLTALGNSPSRFSPEIMQQLAAGSKEMSDAQTRMDIEAGNADAASRGMFSSGFAADQAASARREGINRFTQDVRAQKLEKVKADFEDKLSALDRMQKHLDSSRAAISQFNATAADRERNESAIRLGYAQLDQQRRQFVDQLASNKELLGLSLNSAEFLAGLRLQLGLI